MRYVTSADGTRIAYDASGEGRPLMLVDGALCYRSFGPMPSLAALLASDFTAITYDRRGRGDSGDTGPYAVEREIDDLEALIEEAGGSAFVYGISSGAALALEAAVRLGDKITGLAVYEPPYRSDDALGREWREYTHELERLLDSSRRGAAVALFMRLVGTPSEQIEDMRQSPIWAVLEGVAPTLAYDAAILGEDCSAPVTRVRAITTSATVMNGGAGLPFIRDAAIALAEAIPSAQYRELEGETHAVREQTVAPVLIDVFKGGGARRRGSSGPGESAAA